MLMNQSDLENNPQAFKQQFISGLQNMLGADELGAFILVLANSMQDQELQDALREPLNEAFAKLCEVDELSAPEDDLAVFNALKQSGISALNTWEYFSQAPWQLVYNPLRSLRPARTAQQKITAIQQDFDPQKFNFNKPFLTPEILWEGSWNQRNIRVLYNKFPFAPWHTLIVPSPEKCLPQYLTQELHEYISQLVDEQAKQLSNTAIAFNSLGAYASVNQLHFQGFLRNDPLPLESPIWQHNGGEKAYPIDCFTCESSDAAWHLVEGYHKENQPYNLLYRPNRCYVLPRKIQGTVILPDWAQGIAWHEICGVFTVDNRAINDSLNSDGIYQTLHKLRI